MVSTNVIDLAFIEHRLPMNVTGMNVRLFLPALCALS